MELKNDIQLKGTLKSVDQYLNIKLDDIQVVEELKYPHLVSASLRISFGTAADLSNYLELCQEHVHSRISRAIRALACRICGHTATGGCYQKR